MVALPAPEWAVFQTLPLAVLAACLLAWAQHVRLSALRKHRRGPKKPVSRLPYDPKHPHVSIARLIAQRKKNRKPHDTLKGLEFFDQSPVYDLSQGEPDLGFEFNQTMSG